MWERLLTNRNFASILKPKPMCRTLLLRSHSSNETNNPRTNKENTKFNYSAIFPNKNKKWSKSFFISSICLFLGLIFTVPIINAEESKQTSDSSKKRKIFISYNHKSSKEIVEKFAEKLKQEGYDVWYDKHELHPSDELSKKMEKGIRDSSIVLCFISNEYMKAKNCRLEFFHAFHEDKTCFYLATEKLDFTGISGFKLFLNNDFTRLDLHKLDQNNLINEVFNKLEPKFKEEEEDQNKTAKSDVSPNSDDKKVQIENEAIIKNDNFVVRQEDVFKEISSRLASNKKIVLLWGVPGVGKSSCAVEYILKKKNDGEIDNYFYFPSERDYNIHKSIISFC
jgi:hypothetical protein